jgi:hypothetical protein
MNMAKEQTPAPTLTTNSGAAVEDNQNSIGVARVLGIDLAEFMQNEAIQVEAIRGRQN